MAGNGDLIATNFMPLMEEYYRQSNIWTQLAYDYSGDIPVGYRKGTLARPVPQTNNYYNIEARTPSLSKQYGATASDLTRAAPDIIVVDNVDIELDVTREVSAVLSSYVDSTIRPNVLSGAIAEEARLFMQAHNGIIRSAIEASKVSSNAGNLGQLTSKLADFKVPATYGEALLPLIDSAAVTLDEQYWPREGRYMVVSPYVAGALRKALTADRNFVVTPFNDQMLISAQLAKYQDFDIWMDDSMSPTTPTGNTANVAKGRIYFGRYNEGIGHGYRTITSGFQESSPQYRGAHFWGNILMGADVIAEEKLGMITTKIAG